MRVQDFLEHHISDPEMVFCYLADYYPDVLQLPVKWNGRLKRSAGRCHAKRVPGGPWYATLIDLCPSLQKDEVELRETFLHEVAHAVAGHEANHNCVWEAKARSLGLDNPRRGSAGLRSMAGLDKVVAWCPKCHRTTRRARYYRAVVVYNCRGCKIQVVTNKHDLQDLERRGEI
jgi:hypothetical protein